MRRLTDCMISVALAQVHLLLAAALNAMRAVACGAGATASGMRVRVARNSGGDIPDSCLAVGGVWAAAWTIMACREGRL